MWVLKKPFFSPHKTIVDIIVQDQRTREITRRKMWNKKNKLFGWIDLDFDRERERQKEKLINNHRMGE